MASPYSSSFPSGNGRFQHPVTPSTSHGRFFFPKSLTGRSLLVGFPLLIWTRDSFLDVVRVKDTSMEPTLKKGDLVLVRKCERGLLMDAFISSIFGRSATKVAQQNDRVRVWETEVMEGVSNQAPAQFFECPPVPLPGNVVVFKSPHQAFPTPFVVRRVLGVGGQFVRAPAAPRGDRRLRKIPVAPFSLYLVGDSNMINQSEKKDQSTKEENMPLQEEHITKALVVGVADYVLWPPTRWGRIQKPKEEELEDIRKPKAFWPRGF